MNKINEQLIYSPSDLIKFMESDFITWMDRYNLEFPEQIKPDDSDTYLKILQDKGHKHEYDFLNKLKEQGRKVTEIDDSKNRLKPSCTTLKIIRKHMPFIKPIATMIKQIYTNIFGIKHLEPQGPSSYADTKSAMAAGDDIIYQANLINNNEANNIIFSGYADFLFKKIEGASKLGNWHYEPWDTKLALKAKPYFIIQLCCYIEMLESIQGIRPKHLHVVLGNGDKKSFRTEDYFYFYEQLKSSFLQQQKNFNPNQPPELIGLENYGRWASHAEKILKEQDHLCIIANVSKTQLKNLWKAKIFTVTQLAKTTQTHIPGMPPSTLQTLKKQATLQLKSTGKTIPEYEIIYPQKNDRKGLALLPPSSVNDVWFDMEGYPHLEGGLEYLFGATHLDNNGNLTFKDWWSHNHLQEKNSFQDFINWVYIRWQNDPTMHIYHYAPYEPTALKRLMGRYGICEEKIDNLLRGDVFVDLYKIVNQGIRVGTPNYSLKNIELLYKSKARTSKVSKATDSIVYYERWLENPDGHDYNSSKLLKSIRSYNEDDCVSTKLLCNWLRDLQTQSTINYIAKPENMNENKTQEKLVDKNSVKVLARNLAQELFASLKVGNHLTKEQKTLSELFAYLLEFYNREEKPIWWAMFDRHNMTEDQLIDDPNSLGGLEQTKTPVQLVKNSYLYEYCFDPAQDTKIKSGSRCYYAHDLKTRANIVKINIEDGLVQIKIGPSKPIPPQRLSLIPDEYVSAKPIQESICAIIKEWHDTGKLPQAIEDFLLRRRPHIKKNSDGPIISGIRPLVEEVVNTIKNMNNTTLCIQGPPGSGKTYTAAQSIVELIRDGKTVGITSNSHKAIAHLINKVMEKTEEKNIDFAAVKIQSTRENFHVNSVKVTAKNSASDIFPNSRFKLIGGTAWAFSNKLAKGQLDYLFVDEAGQVSIANLLGMAASTKNIVLMGDQIQLNQPIKGSHPGESGKSCLDYFLGEHQTIPKELGVFLDTTYRLHPDICRFISNTFYEERLKPKACTNQRQIILSKKNDSLITKKSGILFVPVKHEGNSQSSNEEVEKIKKLIKELLKCSFKDHKASLHNEARSLTIDDILIVAPYNMQVLKIKEMIPQVKVGSVDKFQGQEAPVIIVSMCSSNTNDSARGLEFLFSKNRLNVAISRAQVLAIVVGNPELANTSCNTVNQLELTNLFCKIISEG